MKICRSILHSLSSAFERWSSTASVNLHYSPYSIVVCPFPRREGLSCYCSPVFLQRSTEVKDCYGECVQSDTANSVYSSQQVYGLPLGCYLLDLLNCSCRLAHHQHSNRSCPYPHQEKHRSSLQRPAFLQTLVLSPHMLFVGLATIRLGLSGKPMI